MARSILDYINEEIANEEAMLTYEEWCRIRKYGTEEELIEAVARMEEQGGYENLQ